MPVRRSGRRIAAARLETLACALLDASALCAIATAAPGGRAYVNAAYFAWSSELDLVWLSAPHAAHSRNVRARRSVAIAIYDSHQSWGSPDRGIQLFGAASETHGRAGRAAEQLYADRFPGFGLRGNELGEYRFYRFRPRRLKLFDEPALGAGVFVTAKVERGQIAWDRTELYAGGP